MKTNINNIKEIEFACKECGCKIVTPISGVKRVPRYCPNCNTEHQINDNNDPVTRLNQMLSAFNAVSSLSVSLVCGEIDG